MIRKIGLLLTFCILCASLIAQGLGCQRIQPVRKTRLQYKTSHRFVTYRNWIGLIRNKMEPYGFYDTEYYTTYERVCCSGYEKDHTDSCVPTCSPSCPARSSCAAPNVCECEQGYRSQFNYPILTNCQPVCTYCPGNSTCVQPDECECVSGFEKDPLGKTLNEQFKCKPICENGCPEKSVCIGPDVCRCDEGFEIKDNTTLDCIPKCILGCPEHSFCAEPNKCECEAGYREARDGKCEAICEKPCPEQAVCIGPNECQCNDGYKLNEEANKCQPICSLGCPANSVCLSPETCVCIEDFSMNENGTQCIPQCNEACPEHSFCHRPNECQCEEGYRSQMWPATNGKINCEPICHDNCAPLGRCIAPNKCECYPGYELQSEGEMDLMKPLCRPVCSKGCKNAFCFSPETCVCDPGFLMGPNETCTPVCSMGCTNGVCVEPEICKCNAGFGFTNNSVHICQPICEPACENADCVGPNICLCKENYRYAHDFSSAFNDIESPPPTLNVCIPSCQPECENGKCIEGNTCACNEGFALCQYQKEGREVRECVSNNERGPCENFSTTEMEPYDTTTSAEAISERCQQNCRCWQIDEAHAAAGAYNAGCAKVCSEDVAEGDCTIMINKCQCDPRALKLSCDKEGLVLLSKRQEDDQLLVYKCIEPTHQSAQSLKNEKISSIASTSSSHVLFLLVFGISLAVVSFGK